MTGDQLLSWAATILGLLNAAALIWRTLEERRKLEAETRRMGNDADKVDAEAAAAHAQASATISSASGSMIELMRQRLQEITADMAQVNAHRETLMRRVDELQAEVSRIRAEHIRDLNELQNRHDTELMQLRADYAVQISDLRQRQQRQNDGIRRLIHQLRSMNIEPVWQPEEEE